MTDVSQNRLKKKQEKKKRKLERKKIKLRGKRRKRLNAKIDRGIAFLSVLAVTAVALLDARERKKEN